MPDVFPMIAKTPSGLEGVLAEELTALSAAEVMPGRRLVSFVGDQRLLYRANICCRTAIRVLKPIHSFPADSEQALYRGVQEIDWSRHLTTTATLAIDPVVYNSFCTHSLYAAQLAKDAIVDQFRDRTGARPSVDRDDPDLRINMHLGENRATVYLDSSGDSLHKRGYRLTTTEAPLNEVLAAGILRLAGWDGSQALADFMCGSGTLPIEAALFARNIAPGLLGRTYGYTRWTDFDPALHAELLADARAAVRPAAELPIVGSDLDPAVIDVARRHARAAGVEQDIRFETCHFEALEPPAEVGTLVVNPPYDERMKVARIAAVYRRIGDALKHRWGGHTAWLFTGNLEAAAQIGLRTSRRIQLDNGPIECRLLKYEIRRRPQAAVVTSRSSEGPAADELSLGESDDRSLAPSTLSPARSQREREIPRAASALHTAPHRRTWQEQAEEFRNRLARMAKHWDRWARRQGITCYRLYDRDIPEIPLAIDRYETCLHLAEYDRPHDRTEIEHEVWLDRMVETAAAVLGADPRHVFLKRRRRQRGTAQYERQDERGFLLEVGEGGHRFRVNLSDYLDTGLFLDHRITRSLVEQEAAGKRFLNLFGYTGAFTVYAAAGGASETTTVDLSNTYLDWARENMRLNGFRQPVHRYVRDDAVEFLRHSHRRGEPPFDLAVVDPPTFSNSKRTEDVWDVDCDHVELLNLVLERMAPGGKVYFSTNARKFKFRGEEIQGAAIREISRRTVPPDFRNQRIHRAWTLVRT